MRVFIAGATGVIGVRLVPLLVAEGHVVAGMSRSEQAAEKLRDLGAEPIICDVYDLERLTTVVESFEPDVVVHQLTDLPDDGAQVPAFIPNNERMRREGTGNLLAAARGVPVIAQSIAFTPVGGDSPSVREHEDAVLAAGGVVVQYGLLYGPDTWFPSSLPSAPRIHVDDAARRTVPLLNAPSGVIILVDD
ncbi:MAG: NAD-dependent epimerase/dehydratase family protein [Candidatus Nanopelagicales bacterium]